MTILFDFDEVFVDTITGSLALINERLGTKYTQEDVKNWDFFDDPNIFPVFMEFLNIPDVYQRLVKANKDMIKLAKQLVEMGEDVYIVTASLEGSHESKLKFIREHMSFIPESKVFVVNSSSKYKHKSDVLEDLPLDYRKPIVLVDDGIHNILDMMADIKHKEKLDRTMRQFYSKRSLKKYNNRYHDFIYGIIPELLYNRELEDGKRIFKIKEAKDIWGVLKHINDTHSYRITSKQFEIFNYLHNMVSSYIDDESNHQISKEQYNLEYLMNYCYGKRNKNVQFMTEVSKLIIEFSHVYKQDNGEMFNRIIDNADTLFSSVMYSDVSKLITAHVAKDVTLADTQAQYKEYGLYDEKSCSSVLFNLIEYNRRNVFIAEHLMDHLGNREVKHLVNTLLFNPHTGINNIDCLSDKNYMKANLLLILNKNLDVSNAATKPVHVDIDAVASALFEQLTSLEKTNNSDYKIV